MWPKHVWKESLKYISVKVAEEFRVTANEILRTECIFDDCVK